MINTEKIYEYIKNNPKTSFIQIAKGLKIPVSKNKELTTTLRKMSDDFLISLFRNQTFIALENITKVTGKLKYASEGKFAFVDVVSDLNPEEYESFFVPSQYFNKALSGDTVILNVYKYLDHKDEKTFGVVSSIVERNNDKISGVLELSDGQITFKPLKKEFKNINFIINEFKVDARLDDLVMAKIHSYKDRNIEVNIVEKVSNLSDPLCYVKSLLSERELPKCFEENVIIESNNIPDSIDEKGMKKRVDFRNELVVTIDGDSTKDFDDAICVKKIDNRYYELQVHIADVSYYVTENSVIDKEALKRGTSTYLANQVIPMLPEKLSNGICSLNPNEDRFTMSIIIQIDNYGHTISSKLVPGIINSKYRLTYNRVNEFIDDKKRFDDNNLNKMLGLAYELTQKIRNVKNDEGYIDFEIEEPKIIFDQDNHVVDVVVDKSGASERMIEDFMVRANEETAKILEEHKIPLLFRVHEAPSEEKINYFKQVMNALNIKVKLGSQNITPKSFQQTIEKIKQQRFDSFLQIMFLRTMSKAVYSPDNIGHFGLASKHYCHFTSPIRRYPDLIVHRVIREILLNNDRTKIEHMNKILDQIALQTSESEQKAMQIERDTNDLLYAEYFRNKIGQSFNCQIVSVLKFGMFVEFENKTNALIHISTMTDDEYSINDEATEIIGANSKNRYRLGDKVAVVVTKTDPINGKIDACLVKNYGDYFKNLKNNINKPKKNLIKNGK
ncbi:ribonuclease R [Mycoplasma zalophidermidis]|uniref:Ribonuclease R n=1 Tax=Mycoplasma zalophidermidis TaxID=398174 RepID=A0ABS6DRE3_9MOLU|nr:ribonuclease R [Mycoplasma zalophidermidis]MBU4693578.1 ribonuclease R [Mycoplasma zalophidermidis]